MLRYVSLNGHIELKLQGEYIIKLRQDGCRY